MACPTHAGYLGVDDTGACPWCPAERGARATVLVPTVAPYRPTHLSPSSLALYDRCPALFHRRYVLGISDPPTLPMAFGSAVHAGMEAHHRGKDGIGAFLADWTRRSAELRLQGISVSEALEGLGCRLISQARQLGYHGEPERRITLKHQGVPLLGFCDLVNDEEGYVVDFKTTYGKWSQAKADADPWQVPLYLAAFRERLGRVPAFRFVVLDRMSGGLVVYETSRTAEQIEAALQRATEIHAAIVRQAFACSCGRCEP